MIWVPILATVISRQKKLANNKESGQVTETYTKFKNLFKKRQRYDSFVTENIDEKSLLINILMFIPITQNKLNQIPVFSEKIDRGSYMRAHVLLNLLSELWKRDKMRGLPSILSLFAMS